MSQSNQKSVGLSFCGLLTALFVALKLTGYITWSWWWVLAPIWIPWAVVLAIVPLIILIGGIVVQEDKP